MAVGGRGGLTWSEPKVSMVSLPGNGGKRVSLLGYFSCPVYPHDCQEREEVRSKSMLCNDLGPGKDPKPFCDHISFHLLYLESAILLSVTAIFTGLSLSDYSLKMKKMLLLQQNSFCFTSKASHSLCFEEERKRE